MPLNSFVSQRAVVLYNAIQFALHGDNRNHKENPEFVIVRRVSQREFSLDKLDELKMGAVIEWCHLGYPEEGKIISRPWHPDGDNDKWAVEVESFRMTLGWVIDLGFTASKNSLETLIETRLENVLNRVLQNNTNEIKNLERKKAKLEKELNALQACNKTLLAGLDSQVKQDNLAS